MKAKGGGVYGEEIEGEVNLIYEWTLLQWNLIFIGHEKGKACAPNTEGRLKKIWRAKNQTREDSIAIHIRDFNCK